nr:hypothetical protein AQUCO_00300130v1 [Ipomoea batatas]GMD16912.1 hypothetical protein AQUCO_00300130v1 [Ipomoea batatas]GMD86054.1 hypothetical protein AQUCO_00300130v1 [Ipomoea batatas]GME12818.1 hypothetical protein AQUCO_00300130v1 [Ipomoea batatas]GME13674.1 hypothetical protein AQUCO_00300130v1 [Ipomoea batatas]
MAEGLHLFLSANSPVQQFLGSLVAKHALLHHTTFPRHITARFLGQQAFKSSSHAAHRNHGHGDVKPVDQADIVVMLGVCRAALSRPDSARPCFGEIKDELLAEGEAEAAVVWGVVAGIAEDSGPYGFSAIVHDYELSSICAETYNQENDDQEPRNWRRMHVFFLLISSEGLKLGNAEVKEKKN